MSALSHSQLYCVEPGREDGLSKLVLSKRQPSGSVQKVPSLCFPAGLSAAGEDSLWETSPGQERELFPMPEVHNMSDSTVSSHLDGIISDFEGETIPPPPSSSEEEEGWSQVTAFRSFVLTPVVSLKRSFETEEADTSAAPLTRRAANLRSSTSSSSQRLQELVARNSDSTSSSTSRVTSEAPGQRAVKSVLQRVEPSGARVPEPASRRTELSVDVSSRLVDSTPGSGIARFGLRRPDTTSRRAEPAPAASRLPEQPQRKADHPSPVEVPSRRPEVSEDSTGPAASEPQTPSEHKTQQSPLSDVSVKLPDSKSIHFFVGERLTHISAERFYCEPSEGV
ncbi:hypothetical protein Z043_111257 [Scleropages formosus]|uniref:Uncharacterized protein n=1 Tax=Scleropages formosus TaxID=113540 RepID=A0A0P7U6N8_SCLFO|nr:hypothetical protein Z043_111257 [Scleropages formosus]